VELNAADGGKRAAHGRLNRRREGGKTRRFNQAHQALPVRNRCPTTGSGTRVSFSDASIGAGPTTSGGGAANHLACGVVLTAVAGTHKFVGALFQGTRNPGGCRSQLMP